MSTRWYPIYQKGGPQLRVLLPNFWLKLVKPTHDLPPNVVQFSCSMQMTKYDVKSYLENIYNVKTVEIRTRIALGKTYRHPVKGYVVKDDDIKYAYAVLPKDQKFVFPDLFPEQSDKKDEEKSTVDTVKAGFKQFLDKNKERPNMPGWFTA